MRWLLLLKWLLLLLGSLWLLPVPAQETPEWFAESFLDLREDAAEAAAEGKRLMLYFMQDGCPYCTQLVTVNWRQPEIVQKTRRHFVPVAGTSGGGLVRGGHDSRSSRARGRPEATA